jgi:phage shock protein A
VKVPLTIFDKNKSNTVSSISEVKDDVEQRIESAEASLSELRNAISKVSALLLPE